jgi:RNA polymerase sigma-70 factor (ECF subfamily)
VDFAAIIAETKRPVLAAIRRYLDARFAYAIDDVAQEVYLRAYRALTKGKLQDSSKLRSYLYTIARNEALRMNTRGEREEKKAEKFLNARREKLSVSSDTVSTRAMTGEVAEALRDIPEHYAQVVQLSMLGFSAREIVEKLQIRPGTVKSRLSRGLAMLREKLA